MDIFFTLTMLKHEKETNINKSERDLPSYCVMCCHTHDPLCMRNAPYLYNVLNILFYSNTLLGILTHTLQEHNTHFTISGNARYTMYVYDLFSAPFALMRYYNDYD